MSGSNWQPRSSSGPVPPGALLLDARVAEKPIPTSPPLTLDDEIVAYQKKRGLSKLSALRLIRQCVHSPGGVATIADNRLRELINRRVRTGGWI